MKTTEIRGSDIPGFEDAAELQVQSVQAHFRGLAKADALLRFGLFLMPLVRAEVQSAVEEAARILALRVALFSLRIGTRR